MHVGRAGCLQNRRDCAVEEGGCLRQIRTIRVALLQCLHAPLKHRHILEIFRAFANGLGMLRRRDLIVGEEERAVRCLRCCVLVPGPAAGIVRKRPEEAARGAHVGARPCLQALIGVRVDEPGRSGRAIDGELLALFTTPPIEVGECRTLLDHQPGLDRENIHHIEQERL